LIAPRLGDLRIAAEGEPRRATRSSRVEPLRAMALLEHLEVEPQFLTEIAIRPPEAQDAFDARKQFSKTHGNCLGFRPALGAFVT
jgi:hypothetical protein